MALVGGGRGVVAQRAGEAADAAPPDHGVGTGHRDRCKNKI